MSKKKSNDEEEEVGSGFYNSSYYGSLGNDLIISPVGSNTVSPRTSFKDKNNRNNKLNYSPNSKSSSALSSIQSSKTKKNFLGLMCVFLLIVTLVAEAQYARFEYKDINFKNYFFLCYCAGTSLMLTFPVFKTISLIFSIPSLLCGMMKKKSREELGIYDESEFSINSMAERRQREEEEEHKSTEAESNDDTSKLTLASLKKNIRAMVGYGLVLAPLQLFSSYIWYYSLDFISVSMNLALYQTVIIFSFLFSMVILCERDKLFPKFMSLFLCVTGVAALVFHASQDTKSRTDTTSSIIGISMVITSACLYGLFEVLFTKWMSKYSTDFVILFQSLLGLMQVLMFWPLLPIFHYTKFEVMNGMPSKETWVFIIINAAFNLAYYTWDILALTYTSPIYVTVSSMMSLPIAALVDGFLGLQKFGTLNIFGMVVIFLSGINLNVSVFCCHDKKKRRRRKPEPTPDIIVEHPSLRQLGLDLDDDLEDDDDVKITNLILHNKKLRDALP